MTTNKKHVQRDRRRKRIRARISGTTERPRISVFRSNKYVFVQAIDDVKNVTLASAWSRTWKDMPLKESTIEVGKDIAQKLSTKNITEAVFDRGGFIYTGNIAKVAEGIRAGGIKM